MLIFKKFFFKLLEKRLSILRYILYFKNNIKKYSYKSLTKFWLQKPYSSRILPRQVKLLGFLLTSQGNQKQGQASVGLCGTGVTWKNKAGCVGFFLSCR